jgi:hypothetical protein
MRLAALCLLLAAAAPAIAADDPDQWLFPPDAGLVNVKDLGAKGDGKTDDSDAIAKAVIQGIERTGRYASPAFVYFPKGTYLVSRPIESRISTTGWSSGWRAGMILVGEHRTASVIRLKDSCEGYTDAAKHKPVIATGSEADKPNPEGGGNRAFRHSVYNLTIDVGMGNAGAVGIDYVCNNRGAIERVVIRSKDKGYCGLGLERWWPGPALVKHVTIEGFDYGIRAAHYQYSMTFEDVTLSGQGKCAIFNNQNILSFNKLISRNSVPVYQSASDHSMLTVVSGTFTGGGAEAAAITSKGKLCLRDIAFSGYKTVIDDQRAKKQIAGTAAVATYATDVTSLTGMTEPLNLPVKYAPEFHTNDLSQWIAPELPAGATQPKGVDITESLQKAIDSGKPVVYLPNGTYKITKTIVVRGAVRKIQGMQSGITAKDVSPAFRIETTSAEAVNIEHLYVTGGGFEHASAKPVALRHIDMSSYRNAPEGKGDAFVEDTIGKPIRILHPQSLWGRQVNCEFGEEPLLENHGGNMWILGFKTEGEMTCIKTVGGKTELLGAMLYPLKDPKPDTPAFINDGGVVSLTFGWNYKNYKIYLRERLPGGDWTDLAPPKGLGRGPALLVSGKK